MNSANIGWLFYRDYFSGLDFRDLTSDRTKKIIDERVDNIIAQRPDIKEGEVLGNAHLKASTAYPGLLVGTGNVHELPSVTGQAIMGFHFDYTTGLPVLPGSSIKGLLRSAFDHPEYIVSLLPEDATIGIEEVPDLEIEIFGQKNGTLEITQGKDIFFDAQIIAGGQILGDDYLAPHGSGTEEPNVLRFVKVMPNVTFRFDFELHRGMLNRLDKRDLFAKILADLGVGAKTNVGYGKFDSVSVYVTEAEREREREERESLDFEKLQEEGTVEKMEEFLVKYPGTRFLQELQQMIEEKKSENRCREIEEKFKRLDRSNKRHVESFVNAYKDDPCASKLIASLEKKDEVKAFELNGKTKYKQLETYIKSIIKVRALSDEEKDALEVHIREEVTETIKRRRFPFGTFGNEKCLGKERANALADTLNLK